MLINMMFNNIVLAVAILFAFAPGTSRAQVQATCPGPNSISLQVNSTENLNFNVEDDPETFYSFVSQVVSFLLSVDESLKPEDILYVESQQFIIGVGVDVPCEQILQLQADVNNVITNNSDIAFEEGELLPSIAFEIDLASVNVVEVNGSFVSQIPYCEKKRKGGKNSYAVDCVALPKSPELSDFLASSVKSGKSSSKKKNTSAKKKKSKKDSNKTMLSISGQMLNTVGGDKSFFPFLLMVQTCSFTGMFMMMGISVLSAIFIVGMYLQSSWVGFLSLLFVFLNLTTCL